MKLTGQEILDTVCKYYEVTQQEVWSARRFRELIKPRQMFSYIAKEETKLSYSEIGRLVGRDHSTVLVSHRKIENEIGIYEDVRQAYTDIMNLIYGIRPDPYLESMNTLGRYFKLMKSVG